MRVSRGLRNLRVLSNSWGGDNFSQALLDAITAAGEAEILFVAAAGNSASDTDSYPYYPAAYEASNVVSVAATDEFDGLASFSSFGATSVDIAAPGTHVLSTVPDQGYELMDGTSMATPHVAGVAALVLSVNDTLTVDELKDVLLTSGDPIPALSGLTVSGHREHQRFWVDLRWRGAAGSRVELLRNAVSVAVVRNDGSYRDAFTGDDTSYRWAVCGQPGSCSNEVSIDLGPSAGNQATLRMTIEGKQVVKRIAVLDH